MTETNKHLEDLTQIRTMMERSSRFLSLSGLSGVFAGIYAIIGASIVYFSDTYSNFISGHYSIEGQKNKLFLLIGIAAFVLFASLVTGYLFTSRKAKKQGLKIWDKSAKLMMSSLFVPLITGGFICLMMLNMGNFGLVAPFTLIFYGLGLFNASKFSFIELKYLGLSEIILGLIAIIDYGYGLLYWAIGFGLLHIFYGTLMYLKYEKDKA